LNSFNFIDTNVIIYALGKKSPFKKKAMKYMEKVATGEILACTDTEVLQELLHRFRDDRPRGIQAFNWMANLVDIIYPITEQVITLMRDLYKKYPKPSTRDLVHIAVMYMHNIETIVSYDQGFDSIPLITRIEP